MSWMLPGAGNGTCFIFKLSFIGYLVGVGFVPIYSFGVFGGFVYVNLVSERMLDLVFAFLDVPRIALFLFHVVEALFFNSFVVFFVYEVECGWGLATRVFVGYGGVVMCFPLHHHRGLVR